MEKGLTLLSSADVEVGHVDLVPPREFLEDVVVPRGDRVVDVVLGGDKEDIRRSCTLAIDLK
ncbi:hypothetical protein [Methanoculleus receptaculi]|uniref:Uncharacterized protein n=1 Tax=Methanoculleus receptaculi TaxID=394967 RepID=A0AAX4FWU3_9EURY|nr:hypothetical protein [Methanoculleus receptaculi]WOX58355.1 hypothetical protein R6Y96_03695 [Methanoculleus receptaculi]